MEVQKSPEEVFTEMLLGGTEKKAEQAPPKEETPQAPRALTQRSVFSHPDAHPFVLDLVLLKHFDLEWLEWLPDTLFKEIELTFGTSIAEVNRLKILATQNLHVTDSFWDQWEVFEKVIASLNGIIPRVGFIQPPDLGLLMAGVDMANEVRKETFSEEVSRYCAGVFLYENVHYAPEPLSFCQPYITQPTFHCNDCGKTGSALPPFDGVCPSCGGHFETEHPLSLRPDPEKVQRGFGQNVTTGTTFDPGPTKARFEEFEKMSPDKLVSAIRETPEDIQAAKLITAIDFRNFRARQLKEQLESLRGWLETA